MLLRFRGETEKVDQMGWVGWDGAIVMTRITPDLSGDKSIFPPPLQTLCGLACAIPRVRKGECQIE